MDSVKKYHPVVNITPKWLKDNKAEKYKFLSPEFWNKFGEYANKNYNWMKNIEELSKYMEFNTNIQEYNGYFLIKASLLKYPILQQIGANPMPIKIGEKFMFEDDKRNPDTVYDYMIYIPVSNFNRDMRK